MPMSKIVYFVKFQHTSIAVQTVFKAFAFLYRYTNTNTDSRHAVCDWYMCSLPQQPITAYVLLESGWQLLHGTFARGAGRSVVTEGVCTDNNWCSAQQYCRIHDFRNFRKYYIKRQPKNSWPIVKVTSHV